MKYIKTSDERFQDLVLMLIVIIVILFLVIGFFVTPYGEMKAFNALTGCNVSYWDAVFTELRFNGTKCK